MPKCPMFLSNEKKYRQVLTLRLSNMLLLIPAVTPLSKRNLAPTTVLPHQHAVLVRDYDIAERPFFGLWL